MVRLLSLLAGSVLLLVLSSLAPARQDKEDPKEDPRDPTYGGKKASVWVDTLVNDTSARQRALAVEALSKLWAEKRYEDSIAKIARALRVDTSAAVRTQAAVALGSLREVEVKYLIKERQSIGVKDLVDAMGAEKESRVRKEIARSIGRYPDVAILAVKQLTAALKDPDPETRAVAAEALAGAGADARGAADGLAPLLTDENRSVRRAAIIALGRITPEGASTVAETMAKMLGTEKDLDMKVELLTSLRLLGEKSPAVVTALTGLLTDPEDELRRKAARTLGTFGTAARPAADALLKVASSDKQKDIQVDAVHGFGSAMGPDLKTRIRELLALFADPDYEVRLAVVAEVGALGHELMDDKETIKVLRTRLSDPHIKVREAAAVALKKITEKKKEPDPKKEPDKKPE